MGRRGRQRYICWDLDETTGDFRNYRRMGLTCGMRPLLEGLSRLGVRHVITTAAWREHAEFVLGSAGILGLYDGIFGVHDICDRDYNKHYAAVARSLGVPERDAPDRMLVVGNMARDAPADLDLAFIHHAEGSAYNANVFMKIIGRLMLQSDSWAEAHSLLVDQNQYRIQVPGFEGGQQYVDDIWVGVGRLLRNVSPAKPSDRIIAVYSVPESYRSEIEMIKIKEESRPPLIIEPALSLTQ